MTKKTIKLEEIPAVSSDDDEKEDIRASMIQALESADEDTSILLVIDGKGYPMGRYMVMKTSELRGIGKAAWDGINDVIAPV